MRYYPQDEVYLSPCIKSRGVFLDEPRAMVACERSEKDCVCSSVANSATRDVYLVYQ